MRRTGRAYEKPSRISRGLVVGLSIAVVLMAGRLAITILLAGHATTAVVADADKASPGASVENVPAGPDESRVSAGVNWGVFDLFPRDYPAPTPRSALASFAEPPSAAAPDRGPLSVATAAPDVDHRGSPAKPPPSSAAERTAAPSIEATEAIADLLRAPPPPPSPPPRAGEGKAGVMSIPVPRPRPRVASEEDVQPAAAEQSPLDWLIGRQQ